ncbi:MAG TPA: ABC transporter ATP-binding protein [Chlamydiales bacterium]|nr:ABC transporter ATP-binding protein [Chlamydiales bacterium]
MSHISFQSPVWKIFVGPRYSHCKYLFAIFIPLLLTAVFEGGSFAFILLAFSALEGKAPQNLPFFSHFNLPEWLGLHLEGIQLFYFYILMTVLFQAIRGGLNYLALIGTSALSLKIQTLAQQSVCNQIFTFSFPFVSRYQVGDLAEYVKTPPAFIPHFFEFANRILVSFAMGFGLIFVLSLISLKLTIITLSLFLLFAIAQKILIRKISRYSRQLTGHLVEFSHRIYQSLQGIRPVYIFCRQPYILKKTEHVLQQVSKVSKKLYLWSNSLPVLNETISILLVGVTLILGSYILVSSQDQAIVSGLLTYIALTYRLATRLQIGMSALGSIGTYYGPIVRLNEILEDEGKEYLPHIENKCLSWNHSITFQNVFFQYPERTKYALDDLSFSIQKGTTVAFVGLSGAGKSSILDLILGLRNPTGGQVLIDELPLTHYSEESWRKYIGVVSQESFIFHDTVEENIRFGEIQATEEEIQNAAKQAKASDFIEKLPQGYETPLGERGYQLSGGERQRIALARALLKDPPILILDEATSHLDSYSEKLIQHSLDQLHKKKTMIIVTHRLSTVIHADEIFVIEEGKLIEQGSHTKLLKSEGRYAQLWHLQTNR